MIKESIYTQFLNIHLNRKAFCCATASFAFIKFYNYSAVIFIYFDAKEHQILDFNIIWMIFSELGKSSPYK